MLKLKLYYAIYRYQSGFTPPGDIKFEDLSKMDPETANQSEFNSKILNHFNPKGTLSGGKLKKRANILNIFFKEKVIANVSIAGDSFIF